MVRSGTRVAVRTVVMVPTIEGLALALHVSRARIYEWADSKDKPEFFDTVERLQATQADGLIQGGLGHEHKDSIAKLLLSAKLGYTPKSETREVDGC